MKYLYNLSGCSSALNKKIRKFSFSESRLTHRPIHTYAKSDTKPPFARSISTYRVVSQPPGLKSDILHENSPTYRRQPFTSSHIIALPADQSRIGVIFLHPAVTQVLLYSICRRFARDFLFLPFRIFGKYFVEIYAICTNAVYL